MVRPRTLALTTVPVKRTPSKQTRARRTVMPPMPPALAEPVLFNSASARARTTTLNVNQRTGIERLNLNMTYLFGIKADKDNSKPHGMDTLWHNSTPGLPIADHWRN